MDIIGLGALNFDLLLKTKKIAGSDEEEELIEKTGAPGGSAANTIYGLAKLGMKTGFIGLVGDDHEGTKILEDFKEVGTDTSRIAVRKNAHTGLALSLIDAKGERKLYVAPGANSTLTEREIDIDFIKTAKLLHTSSFVNDLQFELQRRLIKKVAGKIGISFSPGMLYVKRGLKDLLPIVRGSNILFLNKKEIETLTNLSYRRGAKMLISEGCDIVAVTLKSKGCFIATENNSYEEKAISTKIIDSTGAGDAFAAGFLYGYLKNLTLSKCGVLGNLVASYCIKELGARKGLPTRSIIEKAKI